MQNRFQKNIKKDKSFFNNYYFLALKLLPNSKIQEPAKTCVKYLLVLVGILALVGSSFGIGHVQGQGSTDQKQLYIYVQIFVRDSDGNLVTYLASDRFTNINRNALDAFLDHEASVGRSTVYDVGDKKFQLIQRQRSIPPEAFGFVASTVLDAATDTRTIPLARFANDGYYVMPGDTVTQVWTFFRQI